MPLLQGVIEMGKPVLWSPSLHKKVVRVLNGNKVEDKVTQFLIAILECIANNILRVSKASKLPSESETVIVKDLVGNLKCKVQANVRSSGAN